jgi:hypothetical protein
VPGGYLPLSSGLREWSAARRRNASGRNGVISSSCLWWVGERSPKARPISVWRCSGLGVGATVIYYRAIAASCVDRGVVPRITIVHAMRQGPRPHRGFSRIALFGTRFTIESALFGALDTLTS